MRTYGVPCCAYPALPLFFFALTLLCPYPALRLPLTGCAVIFLRTLAVLTLLCSYFSTRLPCWALNLFSLTLFYFHLPCCATPLCPYFRLPGCALIFCAPTLLCPYFKVTGTSVVRSFQLAPPSYVLSLGSHYHRKPIFRHSW